MKHSEKCSTNQPLPEFRILKYVKPSEEAGEESVIGPSAIAFIYDSSIPSLCRPNVFPFSESAGHWKLLPLSRYNIKSGIDNLGVDYSRGPGLGVRVRVRSQG